MAVRTTSVSSNFSQRDCRYSTNTKFTVRRTNTYAYTYIQTDTACVQHIDVGLAQARPYKHAIKKKNLCFLHKCGARSQY